MSILTELIERLSNDDLKDILKKLLFEANDKDFISMDGTGSDNPVRGSVTMQLGTGFNWFNPSSNYSQYINSFSDYLEISTSNSSTGDITGITYHPRDVFVYSNYAGFKGFRGSDYWGANISSDPATDNNIFPQVGWVREKNALKMDKPVFPYNVNTRVVLADGGTKPLSEIVTDISGKLDKPTVNGSYVVTFLNGVTSYTDASQFGKNISNANLVWTSDKVQDLGTKKLSFTNGRFSVPTLEMEVTSDNSVPNKIWNNGVDVNYTNNAGINNKVITDRIANIDRTGNGAYSKVMVIHPTTKETVVRDFSDPQATTLAVQNASAPQKSAMRTALLGTATPAIPTISHCFPAFVVRGLEVVIYLNGLNLILLDPCSIWIENGATKVFATNFENININVVKTTWIIPIDFPVGKYDVKIQNGFTVQGLSTGTISILTTKTKINLTPANWRRIISMYNLTGGTYTIDAGREANNIIGDNIVYTQMPLNHEDWRITDTTGGQLFITNNFIEKDKDYDFIVKIYLTFNDGTPGADSWGLGFANVDSSTISAISEVNFVDYITFNWRGFWELANWNLNRDNYIQFIKTGNKIQVKLFDFNNNFIKQVIWTLPDMSKDFCFYIREPRALSYFKPPRRFTFDINKLE